MRGAYGVCYPLPLGVGREGRCLPTGGCGRSSPDGICVCQRAPTFRAPNVLPDTRDMLQTNERCKQRGRGRQLTRNRPCYGMSCLSCCLDVGQTVVTASFKGPQGQPYSVYMRGAAYQSSNLPLHPVYCTLSARAANCHSESSISEQVKSDRG